MAGRFLVAAGRRHERRQPRGDPERAQSATPAPGGDPGGTSITEPLRQALLTTAQRYMLDLGVSATSPSGAVFKPSPTENYWNFAVAGQSAKLNAPNALSDFLQQICATKNDAAMLDGTAKVVFGNLYAEDKLHKLPPGFNGSMAENAMASLLGRIQTEASNVGVNLECYSKPVIWGNCAHGDRI